MISVIMPAYNAEKTIKQAIDSVLIQTYSNFELIIINDFSDDDTKYIVEEYLKQDSRIILINNENNLGVSKSRNIGVELAKGEFIAFLDSDDLWRQDKLEKQISLMKRNNAVLSYTASAFINQNGSKYNYIMQAEEKTNLPTLLRKNIISCSSAMVRTDVMKDTKMPGDQMHEDYYVWIMILRRFEYAYGINEPLLTYRIGVKSKSSSRFKSAKMIFYTYKAVGYNVLLSSLLSLRYAIYSISKRYKIIHS